MIINNILGISVDYTEFESVLFDVHFRDSNGYEFLAYVGNEESHQAEIKADIETLKNIKSVEELVDFLQSNCGVEAAIVEEGHEDYSNDDEPTIKFEDHYIVIRF